ncbi:MAG TPA: chemotaxis protein CheW [Candidatus Synoicihabitans sp.]|nr:chemotaxis protein CheW [Candidatus Synoicihabitans sp.]
MPFLAIVVNETRYGLSLAAVDRVIHLVEITALPKAPASVRGIVDIQGVVLPVIDLRRRFRLPEREPRLSDSLVLARTPRRSVAILADTIGAVEMVAPEEWIPAPLVVPGAGYVAGVVKRADGLILIHDLDACLSLEEEAKLEDALPSARDQR